MAQRTRWLVGWGRPGRFDWHTVEVEAFDEDEAKAIGRELHPELPPPPYAFLAGQAMPSTSGSSE